MPHEPTLIHLVYIHGFNGDETTFQSFPTDLQQYLTGIIPPNSRYTVQSSLYPTYKSVKPISTCTRNFLEWLNTQPPGYVILLAHSMGGLLAAEAVTHASNNPESYPGARPSRIIGMIAFDVPFLGMHPHVVITGLASLFSKDDEKETETQLNDQNPDVHMVDGRVTDDWESYKRSLAGEMISTFAVSISVHSSSSSSLHSPSPSFAERAGGLLAQADGFLASKADDPLVRWARKHRADPFGAGKTWLVDHFQFGVCMFDPPGLTKRYRTLDRQAIVDNDLALLGKGTAELSLDSLRQASRAGTSAASTISSNDSPFHAKREKELTKQREAEQKELARQQKEQKQREKAQRQSYHFVVLPTGLGQILGGGEKWESVPIAGVDNEVAAHCGLFIRGQNLDYDGLVARVGRKVMEFCEKA
ncbi:hypothetical protein HDZ31DRAFT_30701 [Schizophyllum fasciatum]